MLSEQSGTDLNRYTNNAFKTQYEHGAQLDMRSTMHVCSGISKKVNLGNFPKRQAKIYKIVPKFKFKSIYAIESLPFWEMTS